MQQSAVGVSPRPPRVGRLRIAFLACTAYCTFAGHTLSTALRPERTPRAQSGGGAVSALRLIFQKLKEIPGVDYGKVKYPDLMDDIDSLYKELAAARDKPKEEKEEIHEEVQEKLKETVEQVEEVHEQVEEHKEDLKKNVTKEATVEHLSVGDCRDAFAHKDLRGNLMRMQPAGEDPGLGGIIEYDVEKMCERCAGCEERDCQFTKKQFVQCFLEMLETRVGTEPRDCEVFAYQVMSGDRTMEFETDNEELSVRNLAIQKELVRLRKGPNVPDHLRPVNRTSLDKIAPKHPSLKELVRKGFESVRHRLGLGLLAGDPKEGHMEGTHKGIGDTQEALDGGDHGEAMKQMEALKDHMEETHQEMKADVKAHQEKADQVIITREKYEESIGGDGMADTMESLGANKKEALKAFDECDANDETPGDGKLLEKDFLKCELKRVEVETKKELAETESIVAGANATNGTVGNGNNVSNMTGPRQDLFCHNRIRNLISGQLYLDSLKINNDLRRMNTNLHDKLRVAYDEYAEAEANLTAQLLATGNMTKEEVIARANATWHARHLPVLDEVPQVVHLQMPSSEPERAAPRGGGKPLRTLGAPAFRRARKGRWVAP